MKRDRAKRKQSPVDLQWLDQKLNEQGFSRRELARRIQLDQSAVHHLFHGNRRLKIDEAVAISRELVAPIQEVWEAFGVTNIPLGEARDGPQLTLDVSGWLDSHLMAHFGDDGLKGRKTVPSPLGHKEKGIEVLRCQTAGSEFEGLDGALVYFRKLESSAAPAPETQIGRATLVKTLEPPNAPFRLRVLRRGYSGGSRYHLASLGGRILEEDTRVEIVYPVLWIKF